MASIKDVAREAGVSVATVSRVINKKGVCAPATQEAVEKAIRKLGYKTNFFGKALRRGGSNIIMIMLASLANTFCSRVIHAIDKVAEENGYHIMVCTTEGLKSREKYYMSFALNGLFCGIIILNSSMSREEMAELSSNIPVVQCNEYIDTENTPYVTIDNKKAAYDAVTRLIANGNRKVAYYTVDNDLVSTRERFAGYKKALSDNGISYDEKLMVYGNYGYRNAVSEFEKFLDKGIEFDSLFAISDRMAAGAISVLASRKIAVPEAVEVIGFDNTDISYISKPCLTSVSQPHQELGKNAFLQIKDLIDGKTPENIILPHNIVIRESTR